MRVGFVSNVCAHFLVRFFEELAAVHEVEYMFTGGDEKYREPRNPINLGNFQGRYLRGYNLLPKVRVVPSLIPAMVRGRYDVVVCSIAGRFSVPATYLLSRSKNVPFVLWTGLWAHPETPFHRATFPLVRQLYRSSDAIFVYGEHVRSYLKSLGIGGEKIFCAWHTADNSRFNRPIPAEERLETRRAFGVEQGKLVLFVGRLDPSKGLEYLLDAVAGLQRPDVHLVLVGAGGLEGVLRAKAKSLNYENLHLIGYWENDRLDRAYAAADVFVLPSVTLPHFKEPWGIVVNEAMNQSLPIITTDAVGAGVGGLLRPGENGFVVPERNSTALGAALHDVLSDENLALRMGRRSREIIEGWTYDRMVAGAVSAIEYAVRRKRGGPVSHPADAERL